MFLFQTASSQGELHVKSTVSYQGILKDCIGFYFSPMAIYNLE